jgi:GTP cyclohydrolase I
MANSRVQKTGTINKNKIEKIIRQLLVELGENPNREGLIGTPKRIAEMYEEIFSGYKMNSELDVSFSEETNAIIAKDIQFYSRTYCLRSKWQGIWTLKIS